MTKIVMSKEEVDANVRVVVEKYLSGGSLNEFVDSVDDLHLMRWGCADQGTLAMDVMLSIFDFENHGSEEALKDELRGRLASV